MLTETLLKISFPVFSSAGLSLGCWENEQEFKRIHLSHAASWHPVCKIAVLLKAGYWKHFQN
jgi:hypothetical protein